MTIKQFIEKARQGGWSEALSPRSRELDRKALERDRRGTDYRPYEVVLLDPEAWKAVGKVEGWKMRCYICKGTQEDGHVPICSKIGWSEVADKDHWRDRMHRMIDALAEGKTIEQYLETL